MDPQLPDNLYVEEAPEEARFWTARRIVYAVIAIILIIALLATLVWPLLYDLFQPPPPMPTPRTPLPRV
jgi:hypothetical protein